MFTTEAQETTGSIMGREAETIKKETQPHLHHKPGRLSKDQRIKRLLQDYGNAQKSNDVVHMQAIEEQLSNLGYDISLLKK